MTDVDLNEPAEFCSEVVAALESLEPDHAKSLAHQVDRLQTSVDGEQVVGAAKSLIEATCKIVLEELNETYGSAISINALAKSTCRALREAAERGGVRPVADQLARSAVSAAQALGELRNRAGDGHGRAVLVPLAGHEVQLAESAARAWTCWVLGEFLRLREVDERIRDAVRKLRQQVFTRGRASAFLDEMGLEDLPDHHQEALGVATARRWAVDGTFVVKEDVIDVAAQGERSYPVAFARGLLKGLVIDHNGYLRGDATKAGLVGDLLGRLDPPIRAREAALLAVAVDESDVSYAMTDLQRAGVVETLLARSAGELSACEEALTRIASRYAGDAALS